MPVLGDRRDAVAIEKRREHPSSHFSIREHVGDAARHAEVVFEHDEAPVFEAKQIGPGYRDVDVAVQVDTEHLAAVMPAALHEIARYHAFREDASVVIDIFQEQVDRGQALGETALERTPFRRCDDARK